MLKLYISEIALNPTVKAFFELFCVDKRSVFYYSDVDEYGADHVPPEGYSAITFLPGTAQNFKNQKFKSNDLVIVIESDPNTRGQIRKVLDPKSSIVIAPPEHEDKEGLPLADFVYHMVRALNIKGAVCLDKVKELSDIHINILMGAFYCRPMPPPFQDTMRINIVKLFAANDVDSANMLERFKEKCLVKLQNDLEKFKKNGLPSHFKAENNGILKTAKRQASQLFLFSSQKEVDKLTPTLFRTIELANSLGDNAFTTSIAEALQEINDKTSGILDRYFWTMQCKLEIPEITLPLE